MKTAELNNQNTNINKAIRTGVGGGSGNIFSLQQQQQQHQQQQQNHPSIAYQHQGSSHQQHHAKNNKTDQQQLHHHHHHSHNHHQNNQQGQQHGLGRIITPLAGNNALDLSKVPHAKAFYDFSSGETRYVQYNVTMFMSNPFQ